MVRRAAYRRQAHAQAFAHTHCTAREFVCVVTTTSSTAARDPDRNPSAATQASGFIQHSIDRRTDNAGPMCVSFSFHLEFVLGADRAVIRMRTQ